MFSCRQIRHTRTKQFPFKSLKGFVEQPLTYFEDFKNLEILDLFLSSLKLFVEKKVESCTVLFLLCLKKDTLFICRHGVYLNQVKTHSIFPRKK